MGSTYTRVNTVSQISFDFFVFISGGARFWNASWKCEGRGERFRENNTAIQL